ncbi:TonB-dependent receptor [Novosphingobium sp. LASN5T]|uniref:TonB-dependent receptor n=1 Tax=Novosphingobium sp. LASN5T TaxID=2491021 RepID=UPI001CC20A73|nr:TonB-dependent receptor [Novosphingobium sp. LASN5T]
MTQPYHRLFQASPMAIAAAIAVISATPAFAETQPAAEATEAPQQGFGDIVVTANKRSENLQKVGISVSAYSGDQLKALGITDTTQITQQIPAFQLNAWSPNVTIFNLRGISQNNFTDYLEAPVAVYMDDAYMGSINGISGQLFDTKRVEVLRGPQGTLFGRNATGGLVHYISNDASQADFNGYAEASYERFNRRALEGAVGGSITPGLRFRVAGRVVKADGYIKSAAALPGTFDGNGQDLGGENAWALRGTVQADIGSDGKLDLWFKHSEDNHVATGGYVFDNCDLLANGYCHVNPAGLSDGTGGVINGITGAKASPYQNFSNDRGNFDRRTDIYQGKLVKKFGGVELTAITNYTDLKKSYAEDGDALPVTVIQFLTTARYKQFSHELRLSGDSGPFRWQAGAYYLNMKIAGSLTTIGAPVLGTAFAINGAANDPRVVEDYKLRSKNWSLFGQGEYDLSDKLTVIAGVRYSKDNKSIDYTSRLIDTGFPTVVRATDEAFAAVVPGINRIKYGDWAARVGLNYKPNPDTLLFVSWNRGIKGGNWTLSADVTPANFRHDPERLNSFEGGVKWSNADRTLRANLTAYHYIYDNYQAFSVLGGLPQVSNSDARATGTELEVFWQPVKRLNVNLGATWETTKVKQILGPGSQIGPEFFPGAPDAQYCANQRDGTFLCTYPQKAITDAKLPNAPKFSINYLLRYNIDAFGGNLAAQFDGVWYDDQYLEVTNGASSLQKAYNVSNASLTWTTANDRLSVQVFGRNVFDKAYRAYTLNLGILGTTSVYAKPATYGASVTVRW